jgi:hypothetical protein
MEPLHARRDRTTQQCLCDLEIGFSVRNPRESDGCWRAQTADTIGTTCDAPTPRRTSGLGARRDAACRLYLDIGDDGAGFGDPMIDGLASESSTPSPLAGLGRRRGGRGAARLP